MAVHINLTVADLTRSVDFYRRWLGFGPVDRRFPDGTIFIRDAEGTDLALHAGVVGRPPAPNVHFGFRREDPKEVRALHRSLVDGGVDVLELDDEADLVSVKALDPDGYVVEVYWER
jgi:catechol 2,3-dioxygenase-like lactoylglutathione lyase family enzyme